MCVYFFFFFFGFSYCLFSLFLPYNYCFSEQTSGGIFPPAECSSSKEKIPQMDILESDYQGKVELEKNASRADLPPSHPEKDPVLSKIKTSAGNSRQTQSGPLMPGIVLNHSKSERGRSSERFILVYFLIHLSIRFWFLGLIIVEIKAKTNCSHTWRQMNHSTNLFIHFNLKFSVVMTLSLGYFHRKSSFYFGVHPNWCKLLGRGKLRWSYILFFPMWGLEGRGCNHFLSILCWPLIILPS